MEIKLDPMLPMGASDRDEHFNLPSGRRTKKLVAPPAPETSQVWCVGCQAHYTAPAAERWWIARVELCAKHQVKEEAAA